MENKSGKLFIVTGPSGVGKGTILTKFFANNKNTKYSVSTTTRKSRAGEVDGEHYYFTDRKAFSKLIKDDELLEYAKYGENYYGTTKQFVFEQLKKGFDVFLEIEVQGAKKIMEKFPASVSIFIAPPSLEELEHRLRGRNTEDELSILNRLETARDEISEINLYKYNFENKTVEDALNELQKIYESETR